MTKKAEKIEEPENEIPAEVLAEAAEATEKFGGATDKIAELEAQLAAVKDALLRGAADLENTRKRAEKELQDVGKYAISTFAKDMVNVMENLARTLQLIPEAERNTPLYQGVELTRKELTNAFERRGIKQIAPQKGDKFDHNLHQAMTQVNDPSVESGGIVSVMQTGFALHDRLLRPAMVVVSKGLEGEEKHHVDTSA